MLYSSSERERAREREDGGSVTSRRTAAAAAAGLLARLDRVRVRPGLTFLILPVLPFLGRDGWMNWILFRLRLHTAVSRF